MFSGQVTSWPSRVPVSSARGLEHFSTTRAGLPLRGLAVAGSGHAAERRSCRQRRAWVFKAAGEMVAVAGEPVLPESVSAGQLVPQWLSLAEANTTGGGKG